MALNEQQVGQRVLISPTGNPCSEIMWASFKGGEMPSKIVAISAYVSNDRLARQRGGFSVHGAADDLCEIVAGNVLRSIVIPSASKRRLLEALAHLGVTRTALFHDLDALAWEMREQYGIS